MPLRVQVATREMTGRLVPGQPRRRGPRHPMRGVALVASLVLAIPVLWTVWYSLRTPGGVGLDNYDVVLRDPAVWAAIGHSALWAVVALLLVLLGFAIALLASRVRQVWRALLLVLVIPLGMSSLAAGAVFRLIYDQAPQRGTVNALLAAIGLPTPAWLGSGLVWLVLISAFAWSWLGFVVSLFRAGLDAIPVDVLRVAKVDGLNQYQRLRHVIVPMLRPVFVVVSLTMVIAAVRMFDLVLMVVPDPARPSTDVLATRWDTLTTSQPDPGPPAAVAVLLFVLLIVIALTCTTGLRHRPAPAQRTGQDDDTPPARPWPRTALWVLGVVIIAGWSYPVVTMLATALRNPGDAGMFGWWHPSPRGLSTLALTEVANAGIWTAVLDTFAVAVAATVMVLVISVPAAYVLAWGGLPRRLTRVLLPILVMLAVAPVQMYATPLNKLFTWAGLAGSQLQLAVVHAAVGAPFAVLVLRWAFASASAPGRAGPLDPERPGVFGWAWSHARTTVIAVTVLEFVLVWNDFAVGALISGPEASPLTLILRGEARQFATSAAPVMATAAIAAVVPVVVLLVTWSKVVAGLTGGVSR